MVVAKPAIHREPEAPFRCDPPTSCWTRSISRWMIRGPSHAGLLLPATLAGRLGIEQATDQLVDLGDRPGAARPRRKLLTVVHAMVAGCDCIDDVGPCPRRALAGGYKRSPRVSHGLHGLPRLMLTSPFGARAGPACPLDAAFQARDWAALGPHTDGRSRTTADSYGQPTAQVSSHFGVLAQIIQSPGLSLARRKPGVQIPSPPPPISAGQSVVGASSTALSSSRGPPGATLGPRPVRRRSRTTVLAAAAWVPPWSASRRSRSAESASG
jgi:hypothetical protein